MISILIHLYLYVNIFQLGMFYEGELRPVNNYKPIGVVLAVLLIVLFGSLIFLLQAGEYVFDFMDTRLQIKFLWKFYIKNGWRNLDNETLDEVQNRYYLANKKFKGLQRFLYLKCCKMVFARNNRIIKTA